MKQWWKMSLCAVVLVAVSTPASAWGGNKKIKVSFRNIKIVVNGVDVKTTARPFVYEGQVYLPMGSIAEALGQSVRWEGKTETIFVGKAPEGNYLSNYPPYHSTASLRVNNSRVRGWDEEPMIMGGTKFANGVQILAEANSGAGQTASWNLNGEYSAARGLVGLDDNQNGFPIKVRIDGDDKELAVLTLNPGDLPQPVDLPLKGVLKLSITVVNERPAFRSGSSVVDLVNFQLR